MEEDIKKKIVKKLELIDDVETLKYINKYIALIIKEARA